MVLVVPTGSTELHLDLTEWRYDLTELQIISTELQIGSTAVIVNSIILPQICLKGLASDNLVWMT